MSATDTAMRVLVWAISDAAGPPPTGDLEGAVELAEPPPDVQDAGVRLALVTAARLRLAAPPLDDPRPVTCGAVIAAAAIGARGHPSAAAMMRTISPPWSAYDQVALHGIAAAVVKGAPDTALLPALRDASPLTGLLDRPGPGGPDWCDQLLDEMLRHPDGRNLATLAFAATPESDAQSKWRGEVLNEMLSVRENRSWVLDVYETALSWHAQGHRDRARQAYRRLRDSSTAAEAAPTAIWWQALARLDRTEPELLRGRAALIGHRIGIRLYWDVWRLGGIA
jgi:FtsH ternary system domain X1